MDDKSTKDLNSFNDKVSIIIPVYNSAKFLAESIESVLNQTHKNIEIIVVNDGSTDNSIEILTKYSNSIKIMSQKNQGLASSLNAGIKNINNSRWFKWFSPDDILYPESVEICVNIAKNLPENTIVYSNWELIDENGMKIRNFFESNFNDLDVFEFNVRLLDTQQINVNTALIPTNLLQRGCKFKKLDNAVTIDYDFFLQAGILNETKFYLIQKPLLKYRVHENQLSRKEIVKSLSYLPKIQHDVLSKLIPLKKTRYEKALIDYRNKKPLLKKILEKGLRVLMCIFPDWLIDKLLLFYLNKIRRTR